MARPDDLVMQEWSSEQQGWPPAKQEWSWENASEAERLGLVVIGRAVRRARLANGLSQQQLSWRTGVSQATISRIENARLGSVRIRTVARLIGVLGMGPVFLFPGEPPPPKRRLPGAE